ncbi:MAG: DUF692 family protein [Methylophilaceae bacterium]|nr:DUF692 family protein [Methylophilaceae bacterium]
MKAGIGTSFEEVDPAFTNLIFPLADVIEVIPDTLAIKQGKYPVIPEATLQHLAEMSEKATIIIHGVGLSIGSYHGWNDHYFRLLDQILAVVPIAWHSEHLGFINVDGQFVGTMLALPRTREALDLIAERTRQIRERYPLTFLLENIVNVLPDPPAEMTEAAFLNSLAYESGCELLLDIYNLECNAHNQNYAISDFLDELDLSLVREIHVAGGTERAGLMLDIHSRRTRDMTRTLLPEILLRSPNVSALIYEVMPQAVPTLGHQAWADELHFLRSVTAQHES